MRMKGLRAQLTLWHAGLMAMTLLVLALFTYLLLIRVLNSRADAALLDTADTTARQIAVILSQAGTENAAQRPTFLANDLRNWGRYVQVVDPQGNPIEKSDGLQTHPLPCSSDALREGLAGRTLFENKDTLGEQRVRMVTVPVRLGKDIPYLVQAGASLEGLQAALERAAWILLILTPLVFVFSLLGGWLLLGRALRRVDNLTQTALDIQSTNLQRRIEHDGTQDEFGRLAQAFDQMIARLDRSFQQVRRFSSDASHELRTPLTAIRGEAEVALLGELRPDDSRRALRNILDSAERMSGIVESLLLLSRADSGQSLIRREPVALAETVMEAYEQSEPTANRHGVSMLVDEVEELVVEGDPLWLNQIVTNLLTNGAKYTPEGGSVTISLRQEEGQAVIRVRDTGIGIPEEHLPHIFDRFYRVDSGRARAAGGVGLGLSITRWAVEEHGGSISVTSKAGEGSEFVVRLPLAVATSEEEQEGGGSRPQI